MLAAAINCAKKHLPLGGRIGVSSGKFETDALWKSMEKRQSEEREEHKQKVLVNLRDIRRGDKAIIQSWLNFRYPEGVLFHAPLGDEHMLENVQPFGTKSKASLNHPGNLMLQVFFKRLGVRPRGKFDIDKRVSWTSTDMNIAMAKHTLDMKVDDSREKAIECLVTAIQNNGHRVKNRWCKGMEKAIKTPPARPPLNAGGNRGEHTGCVTFFSGRGRRLAD